MPSVQRLEPMRATPFVLFAWLLHALTGCKELGMDAGGEGGGGGETSTPAETCDAYKGVYCAFRVECSRTGMTEPECIEAHRSVTCREGRLASDCIGALERSSCLTTVPECEIARVADPTEAVATCQTVHEAICGTRERCGEDYEGCLNEVSFEFPCEAVIGVNLAPAECLEAIAASPCDVSRELPERCLGLFVVPEP